ncbi:MAG: hypothetical protein WBD22_01740, partial [Pyrinomonadaceae bacterium]
MPEKHNFSGLAKRLSRLPADKRRVALEMSAALAGVSLRVSREFVDAIPRAAKILSADDIRSWAEMGRKIAMGNAEMGVGFFSKGVDGLDNVPPTARKHVFEICTRQLILSSSIALESFNLIPEIALLVDDDDLFGQILKVAADIAGRSAKHSNDFLKVTPAVAAVIKGFGEDNEKVKTSIVELAGIFANRTGGMAADLWSMLPGSLHGLASENAVQLLDKAGEFLEFGGSVTLQFISAGGAVHRASSGSFEDWCRVARVIARQGNAVLISFLRATPKFCVRMEALRLPLDRQEAIRRILHLMEEI